MIVTTLSNDRRSRRGEKEKKEKKEGKKKREIISRTSGVSNNEIPF